MVNIQCTCSQYRTGEANQNIAIALLNAHVAASHANPPPQPKPVQQRWTPCVDRPVLADSIRKPGIHLIRAGRRANDVKQDDRSVQLYSCCGMALKTKLTAMNESEHHQRTCGPSSHVVEDTNSHPCGQNSKTKRTVTNAAGRSEGI